MGEHAHALVARPWQAQALRLSPDKPAKLGDRQLAVVEPLKCRHKSRRETRSAFRHHRSVGKRTSRNGRNAESNQAK